MVTLVPTLTPIAGTPPAGPHGGDGPAVAAALGVDPAELLDLSQSLNPFAPDPSRVVARHLGALGRYPDPARATVALAETMGVDRDRVLLTNGGAEAIALVGAELGRARVDEPDFALYRAPPRARSRRPARPFQPAQPERAPGSGRPARRGVGRGLLSPGDRLVDPG